MKIKKMKIEIFYFFEIFWKDDFVQFNYLIAIKKLEVNSLIKKYVEFQNKFLQLIIINSRHKFGLISIRLIFYNNQLNYQKIFYDLQKNIL